MQQQYQVLNDTSDQPLTYAQPGTMTDAQPVTFQPQADYGPETVFVDRVQVQIVNAPSATMDQLAHRIGGYFLQHQTASDYYDRMFKTLAIPTLIVTSCVPVLEVLMPDTEYGSAGVSMRKVAVVLCGMIATLLVGINNMFEFQSKRDQHRNAAKACQTLKHSFVNNVEVPIRMNMKSEADALCDFTQQVEQAIGDHPMVPAWVREKHRVDMPQPEDGTPQDRSPFPKPLGMMVQRAV